MSPHRHARLRASAAPLALAIAIAATGTAAQAQQTTDLPTVATPLRVQEDPNGVNLVDGKIVIPMPSLSAPGASHLAFSRVQDVSPAISGKVTGSGGADYSEGNYSVHTGGGSSEGFRCFDFDCTPATGTGSILTVFGTGGSQYRQAGTGAVYHFNLKHVNVLSAGSRTTLYYASSIDYPNGETLTFSYDTATLAGDTFNRTWYRPNQVVSSLGYSLTITYKSNDFNDMAWSSPAQATLYSTSDTTTPIGRLTYGAGTITDLAGRVTTCAGCSNDVGAPVEGPSGSVTLPGEATPTLQVTSHPTAPVVASVVKDGVSWTYAYTNLRQDAELSNWIFDKVVVSGPNGYSQTYNLMQAADAPGYQHNILTSIADPLLRTTAYQFDEAMRPVQVTAPEGNSVSIGYDDKSNIASKTTTPKAGSGLAAVSETAYVDTLNCANTGSPVLCYRPVWTRDAAGRQTDYVYNSLGQVTTKTDPADANGVRRKTYVTYETSTGISRPSVIRVCGDITTCGTVDEIRTEYTYWGSTLLPLTESRVDARAGVTLTTTYSYDLAGRLIMKDGPLPGTDDAVYTRYDLLGRETWEIGQKGANGLRPAKKHTYRDADDKVTATEVGTVPGAVPDLPALPTLTPLTRTDMAYDNHRNPTREALSSGGTTYAVTERTFDDRGQLVCQAQRMNSGTFGAFADGCSLTTQGSYGPDRITHNLYDSAGQLTTVQRAYLTPLQQNYAAYEYTLNGKQKAVTDANGNRAELSWDGFDRQKRWTFPSPTTAGVANPSDYEEYGYDVLGNRTSLRKRDATTITYAYDGVNHLIQKMAPASATGAPGYSVSYGYDVRGLQTSAMFGSGQGVTTSYDGFDRMTGTTSTMGGISRTLSFQYDAASNRTRVTHPDGTFITYEYDAAAAPTAVRENGGAVLASFAYDGAGRRYSLGFAGGATTYGYDAISRLASVGHDLAGTASDQTLTFGYNPASQMVGRTSANDAFASNTATNVSRGYGVNGLNQYTGVGPNSYAYDANGNLTSDGVNSYVYDAENRLVSRSGGIALAYDPNGRLSQVSGGTAGTTRFLYDGDTLVAEYDGAGNLLRRYVHGTDPAADDPLIWYEGSGLGSRRSLLADHQGSIIAAADAGGNAVGIGAYDAWGVPNSTSVTNVGRFGYTGQAWNAELGMWYYKARFYSPMLGRFLQTDPVGYKGGVNLYAYALNDPMDLTDPPGTDPGDPYSNPRDAAVDFQNFYNGTSKAENLEYVGAVYKWHGSYYATEGVRRSIKGGRATVYAPKDGQHVEDVHTHGDYSIQGPRGDEYIRTNATGDTFKSDDLSGPDRDRADASGRPVTVGTPSGNYRRYDPHTGRTETIRPYVPPVKPGAPVRKPKVSRPAAPRVGTSCDDFHAGSCGTDLDVVE